MMYTTLKSYVDHRYTNSSDKENIAEKCTILWLFVINNSLLLSECHCKMLLY